jgi:hypothetical protein
MDWVDALVDWLATNGYGVVGTTSFQGDMAADTDAVCIALNEYNGTVYDTMGALLAVDQPMLQVAVRAKSFSDAKAAIKAIRLLLLGVTGQTINGVRFIRIAANGTIHNLNRDAAGRQMFVANFEVWL